MAALIKDAKLNEVMLESATAGSVGSVAVHMRVLGDEREGYRAYFECNRTTYLTPAFNPKRPDRLVSITELYKITGAAVKAMGYQVSRDDLTVDYWFQRMWDDKAEIWFVPWKVSDQKDLEEKGKTYVPTRDADKTVTHDLGLVPWVWVKNLPGKLRLVDASDASGASKAPRYSEIDGACTFMAAIDSMIEIEYQLSQEGRGLKYSMDPTLLVKEPAAPTSAAAAKPPGSAGGKQRVKSPANAMTVGKDGDAKLLEITGEAFKVVLEYVRAIREFAMESVHGSRADTLKLTGAQSGRAMEIMQQALIWLAGRLRVSYGEGALLELLRMALAAHEKFPLTLEGKPQDKVKADEPITLQWPRWYEPTATDRQANATTLQLHAEAGHLSRETAVRSIAADYDIEDVDAEIARIAADEKAAAELATSEGAQVKATQELPA
jgi:hypothetical protein